MICANPCLQVYVTEKLTSNLILAAHPYPQPATTES